MSEAVTGLELTRKDFVSDQEVRWCPGCGDYAILAQMQRVLPQLGVAREQIVFISGIGCSSRFPYYMNTYGIHSIHGRAPTIATGARRRAYPLIRAPAYGPPKAAASIRGNVPAPKAAMNKAPDRAVPAATAPAMPT